MNNYANRFTIKSLSFLSAVVLSVALIFGLQACGSSSSTPVATLPDANPTGYYTGTASVKQADNSTAFEITDLQVFVNGSRIMAMSVSNILLYDITITEITENSYTATATIYEDGAQLETATLTGTIDEGSTLSATFAGAGVANGSFTVTYDSFANAKDASLTVIDGSSYNGAINASNIVLPIDIDSSGSVISTSTTPSAVIFKDCNIIAPSTLVPVAEQNLYTLSYTFSGCFDNTVDGVYTGLVTIFDNLDPSSPAINGIMPFALSNGSFAGTAVFEI